MKLKNLSVLIDAYNLKLKEGSGIKTYAVTLLKALKILGVNVNILFDKKCRKETKGVPDEVMFFEQNNEIEDEEIRDKGIKEKLYLLERVLKMGIGRYNVKKIPIEGKVIKPWDMDFIKESKYIFNIEECYRASRILFKFTERGTNISLPEQIDIWHATYPLPINIKKAKKITTIHDLIPLVLPYTTMDNKPFFYNIVKNALHSSSLIITITDNTKKDILDFFDINPDKIHTTYESILPPPIFSEEDIVYSLKRYDLEFKKYILFVGNIEPKKNIGRLITGFSKAKIEFPLVIVGRKAWLWKDELKKTDTLIEKKKIRMLDYVSKDDLDILYSGALIFVFPSLYEGFGLPPLEAMSFGCPVITSNVSSLPEVCDDAALYVDPYNINDIRDKIELLCEDEKLRDELIAKGKKRVEFFSMENYAKRLYEVYSKVV